MDSFSALGSIVRGTAGGDDRLRFTWDAACGLFTTSVQEMGTGGEKHGSSRSIRNSVPKHLPL